MNDLEKLVTWLAGFDYDDITPGMMKTVKAIILDTLACACLGAAEPESENFCRLVEMGDSEQCTIINGGGADLMTAAFINGCLAQIHDGNDGLVHGETHGVCAHPARLIVPAVIALGEATGASGKAIITAIAGTYEAVNRMCGMDMYTRDMLPAALASAKLLNLGADEIAHAAGFAFHNAMVQTGFAAPMANDYFSGIGDHVRNGVTSALLAYGGGRTGDFFSEQQLFEFDSGWKGDFTDAVYFKPYPACRNINASADLVLGYRNEPSFDLGKIAQITVFLTHGFYVGSRRLQAGAERMPCQLNIFYSLAAALHDGELGGTQYSDARRNDAGLHVWSRRIELEKEVESDDLVISPSYARVEITLDDGTVVSRKTTHARWNPECSPTKSERHEKFRNWSKTIFDRQRAGEIIDVVEDLENISDIRELSLLLRRQP